MKNVLLKTWATAYAHHSVVCSIAFDADAQALHSERDCTADSRTGRRYPEATLEDSNGYWLLVCW
jgi:hypothetical protein